MMRDGGGFGPQIPGGNDKFPEIGYKDKLPGFDKLPEFGAHKIFHRLI